MHCQLPDVRDAVHQLDAHEAHRWVTDDQDEQSPVEVVFSLIVRERTDPQSFKLAVGFELDAAKSGELIGTSGADGRPWRFFAHNPSIPSVGYPRSVPVRPGGVADQRRSSDLSPRMRQAPDPRVVCRSWVCDRGTNLSESGFCPRRPRPDTDQGTVRIGKPPHG